MFISYLPSSIGIRMKRKFKVGDWAEHISDDNLRVYIGCVGQIVEVDYRGHKGMLGIVYPYQELLNRNINIRDIVGIQGWFEYRFKLYQPGVQLCLETM